MNINENTEHPEKQQETQYEVVPVDRRSYFAIQFATRLLHVKQVAPGKLAVPRNSGQPTMQIQCEMGVALKMADDLMELIASTPPGGMKVDAQPEITEPTSENSAPEQGN